MFLLGRARTLVGHPRAAVDVEVLVLADRHAKFLPG